MMDYLNEGLKKAFYTSVGIAAAAADRTEKAVDTFSKRGEETVQKSKVFNEELKRKKETVQSSVKDVLDSLGDLSREELELIRGKLSEVEKSMGETGKEMKLSAEAIKESLGKMSREELTLIRAKLNETAQNWTDGHDEGAGQ